MSDLPCPVCRLRSSGERDTCDQCGPPDMTSVKIRLEVTDSDRVVVGDGQVLSEHDLPAITRRKIKIERLGKKPLKS